MITFKKVFYDLYDLKKEKFINDYDIHQLNFEYDYLLKYWKKKNHKRFITYFWIDKNKYSIAFDNDLKKDFDLKNEIKKQVENKIENLNIL